MRITNENIVWEYYGKEYLKTLNIVEILTETFNQWSGSNLYP